MKNIALILAILVNSCSISSQGIHELEAVKGYYKDLQLLNTKPTTERLQLDAISFPVSGRTSGKMFIGIEPAYLNDEDVHFLKTSLRFPANSSEQTRAELDYLLELELKRTPAQESRAMEIARIGFWPSIEGGDNFTGYNIDHLFWEYDQVFNKTVNANYQINDYPTTVKLLAGVTRDMRIMEFTVKYHLMRARPYHIEPQLKPMAQISSPSFASGHTLWAYIQAYVWSEIFPLKRKEFLAIAFEVGQSREIMGIHYPSDEEAARILAHKMLTHMLDNPVFKKDLKGAKLEWH